MSTKKKSGVAQTEQCDATQLNRKDEQANRSQTKLDQLIGNALETHSHSHSHAQNLFPGQMVNTFPKYIIYTLRLESSRKGKLHKFICFFFLSSPPHHCANVLFSPFPVSFETFCVPFNVRPPPHTNDVKTSFSFVLLFASLLQHHCTLMRILSIV